jgi:hypothetical protein
MRQAPRITALKTVASDRRLRLKRIDFIARFAAIVESVV